MNKKIKVYALVWLILFALFNVLCFVTPNESVGMSKFGGAFWAGYIFITIAFIGQLVCACIALKTDDKTKLFYNIPIIRLSYTGLILTMIFGGLCMVIPDLPNWVGILICLLILAFNAIAVIKAKAAADIVENVDTKVKTQTFFIRSLTVDADTLMASAESDEAKAACRKVYEALRYSDPMSNEALATVENQIAQKFGALSSAVTVGSANIDKLADELVVLIGDRNKKCKLVK